MDVQSFRIIVEIILGLGAALVGLAFKSRLDDLKEVALINRKRIEDLETKMASDVTSLNNFTVVLKEHTEKEEVYWGKLDELLLANERAHSDLKERLARIETKVMNGR